MVSVARILRRDCYIPARVMVLAVAFVCPILWTPPNAAFAQTQSQTQPSASSADKMPIVSDIGHALGWLDNQLDKAIAASEPDKSVPVAVAPPTLTAGTAAPQLPDTSTQTADPAIASDIEEVFGWLDDQLDKAIAASEEQGAQDSIGPRILHEDHFATKQSQETDPSMWRQDEATTDLMHRIHPLALVMPDTPNAHHAHEDGPDGLLIAQDVKSLPAADAQSQSVKMAISVAADAQTAKPVVVVPPSDREFARKQAKEKESPIQSANNPMP